VTSSSFAEVVVAERHARARAAAYPGRAPARVFGIDVEIELPIWPVNATGYDIGGRRTVVEGSTSRELCDLWRAAEPTRVRERLFPNGQKSLTVDYDPGVGYRVWACRMGCHLVSPDGSHVFSVPSRLAPWVWQRLLFGQVLPLAAALHGLEPLHASAVISRGKTLAFSAASGTGKTSLAAHLVAGGAELLTDDVLAVEVGEGGRVLAHPGGPVVALAAAELKPLRAEQVGRIGVPAGGRREVMLKANLASRPSFLDAVYTLERSSAPGKLEIRPLPPDPLLPIGQSFNGYVRSEARVVNQLAVCAAFIDTVQMFSVAVPGSCPATEVAAAVRTHAEEAL
jgi:hypothetical protein